MFITGSIIATSVLLALGFFANRIFHRRKMAINKKPIENVKFLETIPDSLKHLEVMPLGKEKSEFEDMTESDLITNLLIFAKNNDKKAKAIEVFLADNFYGLGDPSDPPNVPKKTFDANYRARKRHSFTLIQGGKEEETIPPEIA